MTKRHRLIRPICIPCMINGAYNFLKFSKHDQNTKFELMKRLIEEICKIMKGDLSSYMEVSLRFYEAIFNTLGYRDFFKEVKDESNRIAKRLLPIAEKYLAESHNIEERLFRALKIASIGNMLDFATGVYNIKLSQFFKEFKNALEKRLIVLGNKDPIDLMYNSRKILYVTDNAGEIIFDSLVIRELRKIGKIVIVAVRAAPIQNDATLEDAVEAGINRWASITTTGARLAGILPRVCSPEFLKLLRRCDLAILKGQGNYQSSDEVLRIRKKPTIYVLNVKCEPVADDLRVRVGDLVIRVDA